MVSNAMTVGVRVEGTETIAADLQKELQTIGRQFAQGLINAAPDIKDTLTKHIQRDVYDKLEPKEYNRRRFDGGIIDLDSNCTVKPYEGSVDGDQISVAVRLSYKPDGTSDQWAQPRHGDALIGRIESGDGYEWWSPGKRPFWKNFVDELIEGGALADAVFYGLNAAGLTVDGNIEAVRQSGDGNYSS